MILLAFLVWNLECATAASKSSQGFDPSALRFSAAIVSAAPEYRLKFTPPAGHHFNLGAPAKVELENGANATHRVANLTKEPQKVTAAFGGVDKLESGCQVQASLYVCDEANTYCRPVKQDFDCETLAQIR